MSALPNPQFPLIILSQIISLETNVLDRSRPVKEYMLRPILQNWSPFNILMLLVSHPQKKKKNAQCNGL